jgi:hypothetical protein
MTCTPSKRVKRGEEAGTAADTIASWGLSSQQTDASRTKRRGGGRVIEAETPTDDTAAAHQKAPQRTDAERT